MEKNQLLPFELLSRIDFSISFNLPRLDLSEVHLVNIGFSSGWDLFGLLRLAVIRDIIQTLP